MLFNNYFFPIVEIPHGMDNLEGEGCPILKGHSAVICAKTAEPIEMPFGLRTRVGQRNHVLDGVQIPLGRGNF